MTTLVPVTDEHIHSVFAYLRPADLNEIRAASGRHPLTVLYDSVASSVDSYCAITDGVPSALLGVCEKNPGEGLVWMVGTPIIEDHPKALIRLARAKMIEWHWLYPVLSNVIDCRNKFHISFLRWLGCTFGAPFLHRSRSFMEFYHVCPSTDRSGCSVSSSSGCSAS